MVRKLNAHSIDACLVRMVRNEARGSKTVRKRKRASVTRAASYTSEIDSATPSLSQSQANSCPNLLRKQVHLDRNSSKYLTRKLLPLQGSEVESSGRKSLSRSHSNPFLSHPILQARENKKQNEFLGECSWWGGAAMVC